MPNQRDRILVLHEQGMCNCDFARKLGATPLNVRRAIKRLQELGHTGNRPRSGRKSTINTPRNHQLIKRRVQRNLTVSMRKIASETGISRESVCRIAKKSFNSRVQILTVDNNRVRLERRRRLFRRVTPLNWERILFPDDGAPRLPARLL